MSNVPVKLLLADQDPIFRLGLRVALEKFTHLQVVSEAETYTTTLQILAELAQRDPTGVNLVILELGNGHSQSSQQLGLQLCQQLKAQYPNLLLLLLSSVQEHGILLAAKSVGVDGYCPKGTPISTIVNVIQEIVSGGSYWFREVGEQEETLEEKKILQGSTSPPLSKLRNNLRLSGIDYINTALEKVTTQLQAPGLPLLEQAILAGKRRELLAARWLLNQVLSSANPSLPRLERQKRASVQMLPQINSSFSTGMTVSDSPSLLTPQLLQASLFASCINKLQLNLTNLTNTPLELDILRLEKKRELLYIILKKFSNLLNEICLSSLENWQFSDLQKSLLIDIWKESTTEFYGKFSRLHLHNMQIEIVAFLLKDVEVVKTEILNKIPLIDELFSYLLFQKDLIIDNILYSSGSIEAKDQALIILENLLIQVANAVVQPLLNKLADLEEIKQSFYDRQMISSREIERFRNNLSWKYRIRNYITEPKAIFESSYELFVLTPRGIATVSVYAPRSQELTRLTGIPLIVTYILEFCDAIAPRLQSLFSFFGSGVVFLLTQVIGRGLGLIGRGILQGIGNVSLYERKNKHN
jgi:DNA-binding NarL/FixJ family response regulator